jgi:hypothetical protein
MRTPGSREPGRRRTEHAPLVRRRFGRRLALGVTAFTAMAVAGAPAVLALQHHGAAAVAVSTTVPLLATTAGEPAGAPVDGIHADTVERVLFHIHSASSSTSGASRWGRTRSDRHTAASPPW